MIKSNVDSTTATLLQGLVFLAGWRERIRCPLHSSKVAGLLALVVAASSARAAIPAPEKVACAVADVQTASRPDQVRLTGWVGSRISANEANRLVKIDPARLLEGYRRRPGRQSWDGEHVGKWLHAATLAWVNTGDAALRRQLDEVVVGPSSRPA
jgi:hypothetical protein